MPDAAIRKQVKQGTEKHSQSNKRYEYLLTRIHVQILKYRQSLVTTLGREGFGITCNYNSHLSEVHIANILTVMLNILELNT